MKAKRRVPIMLGEQAVSVISALEGGTAEKVLRAMSRQYQSGDVHSNHRAVFGDWDNGVCEGIITYLHTGEERHVVLKLGVQEGAFLKDVDGKSHSIKNQEGVGSIVLHIGRGLADTGVHLEHAACHILVAWVMHGYGWISYTEETGEEHYNKYPWGLARDRENAPETFVVVDGGMCTDLGELPPVTLRSTHVGALEYSDAVVAMREWGRDEEKPRVLITEHHDVRIGTHISRAGGLDLLCDDNPAPLMAQWRRKGSVSLPDELSEIYEESGTPLGFHMAATHALYPGCVSISTYLMVNLGLEDLRRLVERVVRDCPRHLYYCIQPKGAVSRFKVAQGGMLQYEGGTSFSREEAVENLMDTFVVCSGIEYDPGRIIPVKPRLYPDGYFWTVVVACLSQESGVAHHLSGRNMREYWVTGITPVMRIRLSRLFESVKDILGISGPIEMKIYGSEIKRPDVCDQYDSLYGVPERSGA